MPYDIATIQKIIKSAAREELLPRFSNVKREQKSDGSFVTEADLAVQHRIKQQLSQQWPDTLFLGEEMTALEQSDLLSSSQAIWILDPLDGTSNFAAGIPYFSVALALLEQGEVSLGLVYDPIRDECFMANKSHGATRNNAPLILDDADIELKQSTAIIDFKRLDKELAVRLATDMPYSSQRSFGSVALDWCWLAAGRGHLYLHGRSNIWDYAAGNFIFQKAGGYSCTLDGEPIFVHNLQTRSSVAAVDKSLFSTWSSWLGIDNYLDRTS